jgi:hypothetical protein
VAELEHGKTTKEIEQGSRTCTVITKLKGGVMN